MRQRAYKKDDECAFGVLQSWFAIVVGPARFWNESVLHDIMTTYIIMQNMIVEDERDLQASIVDAIEAPAPDVEKVMNDNTRFEEFLARYKKN